MAAKSLEPGIYVPTVAFFTPQDDIDVDITAAHAIRLACAGVAGLVTQGSNGEAVHLSHTERSLITRTTRRALDGAGYPHLPVIAGCGAQSLRESVELCKDAANDGASHVLILPPSYYGGLLPIEAVRRFFRQVADKSPLPVVIYNFPAAASGLDLSSDVILELAEHENIAGVKLTCGNTGKLARIVGGTLTTKAHRPFRTFGGSADFLVQTLAVGGHGVIAGLGNLAPKACRKVMELWRQGKHDEAREMQYVLARGDWVAIRGGFVSVKTALRKFCGYGGEPRLPCALPQGKAMKAQEEGFEELMKLESIL